MLIDDKVFVDFRSSRWSIDEIVFLIRRSLFEHQRDLVSMKTIETKVDEDEEIRCFHRFSSNRIVR